MVNKYARLLEEREINERTEEVWTIDDVPRTWKNKTKAKVEADGYHFSTDGTAVKDEA